MPYLITPQSSARVDIVQAYNATFANAYQFDAPVPGVTGPDWSFTGQKFIMEIEANHEQNTPLLTLTSDAGEIVVDDADERVLHFNASPDALQAVLVPGTYIYDLVMYDTSDPPISTVLMHGKFIVTDGVSEVP